VRVFPEVEKPPVILQVEVAIAMDEVMPESLVIMFGAEIVTAPVAPETWMLVPATVEVTPVFVKVMV
jgi:hypothetical protein